MIFPDFETDKSIIVAGVKSTGKSFLIRELQRAASGRRPPILHREKAEKEGIPLNTLVHWPIAEKECKAGNLSYENVELVILLNKCWHDYCFNVNERGQATQYSSMGFEQICDQWEGFFRERHLPILFVDSNWMDMTQFIAEMKSVSQRLPYL
jgi:hypothetical protein